MKLPVAIAILLLTGMCMYLAVKDYGGPDVYHKELTGTLECMGTKGVNPDIKCIPGIRTEDAQLYALNTEIAQDILMRCQGLPVSTSGTSTPTVRLNDQDQFIFIEEDIVALGATRLLFPDILHLCAT